MQALSEKTASVGDLQNQSGSQTINGCREQPEAPLTGQQSAGFGAPLSEPTTQVSKITEETNDLLPEYDPRDHGIRRIIRNFTPSYVPPRISIPLEHPANSFFLGCQMVHHHHEHGRSVNHTSSTALQRALAAGHLCHLLHHEPRTLPSLHGSVWPTVYPLSSALPCCAPPSAPKLVLGYFPSRPCDSYQHDCIGVCPGVGPRLCDLGMGSLVDRHRAGAWVLFSPYVCDVSASFSPFSALHGQTVQPRCL